MLTELTGDILNVKDGIVCHQVNYFGVMGGGAADCRPEWRGQEKTD